MPAELLATGPLLLIVISREQPGSRIERSLRRLKSFPVFHRLDVHNYGLFPGREGETEGVGITFRPGLTLVVGANGLGKTTLITLLFRMLTGPYDIPQLGVGDELGFRRLAATAIPSYQRNMFAARVADRAASAAARLEFALGHTTVTVERLLSNLTLRSALVDSTACQRRSSPS
jgi:hypothetical protein